MTVKQRRARTLKEHEEHLARLVPGSKRYQAELEKVKAYSPKKQRRLKLWQD